MRQKDSERERERQRDREIERQRDRATGRLRETRTQKREHKIRKQRHPLSARLKWSINQNLCYCLYSPNHQSNNLANEKTKEKITIPTSPIHHHHKKSQF